jgi:hypothetical protein
MITVSRISQRKNVARVRQRVASAAEGAGGFTEVSRPDARVPRNSVRFNLRHVGLQGGKTTGRGSSIVPKLYFRR